MRVENIISSLAITDKERLYELLKKDLGIVPQLEKIKSAINNDYKIICPHCESFNICGHGVYKGRKRYKCKKCNKTFNDFTGTAVSGIKKIEKFQEYIGLTIESYTIRKAAKTLKVSTKTIFDWRHKLLSSLTQENGQVFSGIVECDDKQLNINEKGNRNLKRKAYKRSSDRQTKRGVSNDKVSIIVATDRKDNPTMKVAKIGRINVKSIEQAIGNLVSNNNVICSDSHPSIISWAGNKNLEHHTFVASRQHVKNKCYHVQHVNSIDNRYERWIKPFYGVSTKYLPQYLNWFVFLEKIKKSVNPIKDFSQIITKNVSAINVFREIEENYLNLDIPHYSNT